MNKDIIRFIKKCLKKDIINIEQTNKMLEILEIEKRAKDIWTWAKYYFPHKFEDEFCEPLHNYLWNIKDEELTSTLAPRLHAKTTISCFLIPLYLSLHSTKYKFFYNIQNTTDKAKLINNNIKKEFENNELLIKDYGDQVSSKWTEKIFILKNGIIFGCAGAGESIRGINVDLIRPDYIVVDDLYVEQDIGQSQRIKKMNDWFWSTLYPAKAKKNYSIHVQGTAIGKDDLMHELSNKKDVKFRKFKALIDEGLETEDTLWFDMDDLMEDKNRMGSIIFSREFQNELRDDETAIIKESWIQGYDSIPAGEKIIKNTLGVDPAISEKKTADYTGKIGCYISKNHNFYIYYADNARKSFNENIEHIKAIHGIHKFKSVRIECIAAFQAFGQELKRKTRVPVKEIKSVKGKLIRKENISHFFENKKVFISNKIDKKVRDELIYQLINNSPKNDDMMDALILCLEEVKNTSIVGMWG